MEIPDFFVKNPSSNPVAAKCESIFRKEICKKQLFFIVKSGEKNFNNFVIKNLTFGNNLVS